MPGRPATAGVPAWPPCLVAVSAIGGGAGRTTVSVALGQLLASVHRPLVVVVEATGKPLATMSGRMGLTTRVTTRDLVGRPHPTGRGGHPPSITVDGSGLHALVGDNTDGAPRSRPRSMAAAVERLAERYPLVLLDLPADPTSRVAWPWVSKQGSAVVLVSRPTGPDLTLLAESLPVLARRGLVSPQGRIVVVVNRTSRGQPSREARIAEQLVAAHVRSVVRLPYDEQLLGSRPVVLSRLSRRTRSALQQVAAGCGVPIP